MHSSGICETLSGILLETHSQVELYSEIQVIMGYRMRGCL